MQESTSTPLNPSKASESLLRPGANMTFFAWLALLGIPALLLFLIYGKMEERNTPANLTPRTEIQQVQPAEMPQQHAPATHP